MNQCLVTKLKASVNNDSLPILGGFIVKVTNLSDRLRMLFAGCTMDVDGSATIYDNATDNVIPVPFASIADIKVSAGTYKLVVKDKYNLTQIAFRGTNDNDLRPCVSFNIEELEPCTELTVLSLSRTKCYGDIKYISGLTSMSFVDVNYTDVTGDIASLGKMTNLTNWSIANSKLIGSIENFVKAQRANGRTVFSTGIPSHIYNTNITFNGVKVSSNPADKLTWTENTITLGSVTVND